MCYQNELTDKLQIVKISIHNTAYTQKENKITSHRICASIYSWLNLPVIYVDYNKL